MSTHKKPSHNRMTVEGKKERLSLEQRLAKVLISPIRVEILKLLNCGEWSPRELQEELEEGLSKISYHVKVLKDHELIEMTKTAPRRGATEHFYRAVERAFVRAGGVQDTPKSAQGIIVANRIAEIDEDLSPSLESGKFYERDDWHASRTPVDVDGQGCEELEKLADEVIDKVLAIQGKAINRRASGEGDGDHIWITAALLIFGSEIAGAEAAREKNRELKRAGQTKEAKEKKRKPKG